MQIRHQGVTSPKWEITAVAPKHGSLSFPMLFVASVAAALTKCPNYLDVYDKQALQGFNQLSYQGEWYAIAHNEPTEPKFCECDKTTWIIDPSGDTFTNTLSAHCYPFKKVNFPFGLPQGGQVGNASLPGLRTEGAGASGKGFLSLLASPIPNMLLYVEQEPEIQQKTGYQYTAAIVFSCKENHLFQKVFSSLQIYSRLPEPGQDKIQQLIKKALDLGIDFDPTQIKIPKQSADCPRKTSTTCPTDFCPEGQVCGGGMVNVPGVPPAKCVPK
ncbi:hypothetical protein EDD86DRAFT_14261 [Gorgonomyces haynaldii]|nr:hypothetical protein EDD86DRAFT_14261 [Gorgonomyces haynaldii]